MKRKLFTALITCALIVSLSTAVFAGAAKITMFYNGKEIKSDANPLNVNGRVLAPVRALAEAMGGTVTWDKDSNQISIIGNDQSAQIANLERALAPATSLEAVNSWAEGLKARNGAWQYAVMTPNLKKKSFEDFAAMNWSTGTSSPWIKSFEVKELGKMDENTFRYSVTFTWTDSTNATSKTTQYLTVKNIDDTWLVDAIDNLAVRGEITKINLASTKDVESIFAEGSIDEAMYEQATAIIGPETKIYQGNTSEELKPEDLKVGSKIEVVFGPDPMIMIYPPQAIAKEIRVF